MTARPDMVFLFSDQHARRVAGTYGDPVALTPNLDRFAAEGVAYDACYTPSPVCGPARMAMLTGRYPHQTGSWTNNDMLPSDVPTYAHALTAAGYEAISVGRLHSLGPDQFRGFSKRLVGDHSPAWPGAARHDMGVLRKTHGPNRVSLARSGQGNSAYQSLDEATLAATLERIDRIAEARNAGSSTPFFLQVGFMLPHPPYVAREEDLAAFRGMVPPPEDSDPGEHPWTGWWRENREIADVSDAECMRAREAYYALVRRLDANVGAVLDRLALHGLLDDALTVYASDHGDHLGERGLWWKHTHYDASATVPLILRWPGRIRAGERVERPVSLLDVSATFVDVAGASPMPRLDGRSLLDAANAGPVFSEYCVSPDEPYAGGQWTVQRMVRDGRWKAIIRDGWEPELFDLRADPLERHNLAGSPEAADVLADLTTRALDGWNPLDIRRRMQRRAEDKAFIRDWAEKTRPPASIKWDFDPNINVLDGVSEVLE